MRAIKVNENTTYSINRYGIKEPIVEEEIADNIDLAIVPCMACGKDLSRLGHGKGYYDRFLKDHPCYKVALCFDRKMMSKLPMDNNDINMDKVVSENI